MSIFQTKYTAFQSVLSLYLSILSTCISLHISCPHSPPVLLSLSFHIYLTHNLSCSFSLPILYHFFFLSQSSSFLLPIPPSTPFSHVLTQARAWLPVEARVTPVPLMLCPDPSAFSCSRVFSTLLHAPRALNDPVTCSLSGTVTKILLHKSLITENFGPHLESWDRKISLCGDGL